MFLQAGLSTFAQKSGDRAGHAIKDPTRHADASRPATLAAIKEIAETR